MVFDSHHFLANSLQILHLELLAERVYFGNIESLDSERYVIKIFDLNPNRKLFSLIKLLPDLLTVFVQLNKRVQLISGLSNERLE